MGATEPTAEELARRLRGEWERRARSPERDFFVASHPGWRDPERWREQARRDLELFLWRVDRAALARQEVLEIGCGVGRIAELLAPLARGYTGIDVAPGMVAEARQRCAALANARFLASDGLGLPREARDRRYDLVLALAVFIHCPRPVIAALARHAVEALAPGGELRFQVRADPEDPEGLVDLSSIETVRAEARAQEREADAVGEPELARAPDYMGAVFRYAEVAPFLAQATGGRVTVLRPNPAHVYGWIRRAEDGA